MSEYKIGKVYKIIHNQSNVIYIGSTFNTLRDRWWHHKSSFNGWLNNKNHNYSIFKYFKEFRIENFKIILIKEYKVVDRKHLESKEQLWISKLSNINQKNTLDIPKLSNKLYNKNNKERIKEYYENNKEQIKEYVKNYNNDNKEIIKEKKKEYRKINKEILLEKFNCECGGKYIKIHKSTHEKTKKHIKFFS